MLYIRLVGSTAEICKIVYPLKLELRREVLLILIIRDLYTKL